MVGLLCTVLWIAMQTERAKGELSGSGTWTSVTMSWQCCTCADRPGLEGSLSSFSAVTWESCCVGFPVGLNPTPGLGHTVTTYSLLGDLVAALFWKVSACIRNYKLFYIDSMAFPRYPNVLCVSWITQQSVSVSFSIRRAAVNTQGGLSTAGVLPQTPQLL